LYISLYDLGLFFLFAIAIIGGGYLIAVLHRLLGLLVYVKEIVHTHNADISETLTLLPRTLANVSELAVSLKRAVDQTGNAVGVLHSDFTDTVDDLRDGLETVGLYARIISEVFKSVFYK
jgi:hypothetical protein